MVVKTYSVLLLLLAVYSLSIIIAAPLGLGLSTCILKSRRDLGGLLGDDDDDPFGFQTTERTSRTVKNSQTTSIPGGGLGEFLTDGPIQSKSSSLSSTPTLTHSSSITSATTSSNLNVPSVTTEVLRETASAIATQTPSATSTSEDSKQWKTIGIAVIVVSVVAAVIFVVVFFDQWWRFLRDMVLGRKTGDWTEDLVPDWEKRSWEFKPTIDECPSALPFPSEPPSKQKSGSPDDTRHPFPERSIRSPSSLPEAVGLRLTGCGTYRARRNSDGPGTLGTDAHVGLRA